MLYKAILEILFVHGEAFIVFKVVSNNYIMLVSVNRVQLQGMQDFTMARSSCS